MKIYCANGNVIDYFYDSKEQCCVSILNDPQGDQIGDADYSGDTKSARFARSVWLRENGGKRKFKNQIRVSILTYQHNEYGTVVSYHGSESAARTEYAKAKKLAAGQYDVTGPDIREHLVTMTKAGFINFLRVFTPNHDNG